MIAVIAAFTKMGRVIGNGGKIPWNIPVERARFRTLTMGNAVVMGRKTFEEIGKPLADRLNIVVSSTKIFCAENCLTVRSLEAAVGAAFARGFSDIFIAGGRRLYEEALPLADFLYLTEIHTEYSGDVFFPRFDEAQYRRELEEETGLFTRYVYRRKKVLERRNREPLGAEKAFERQNCVPSNTSISPSCGSTDMLAAY